VAIQEQQLIIGDLIQMTDYLLPKPKSSPIRVIAPGPAPESMDLNWITPSFPQITYQASCERASMGEAHQDEAGRAALPDALDDRNPASVAIPRPKLKIVFVDSCSPRRSTRLRNNQTRAVQQSNDASSVAEHEIFGDDPDASTHGIQREASQDESDQDYYDDDQAGSSKRPRAGRNVRHPRKQKRHGRLGAADRDLIFEAQQGGLAHKPPKDKASRIAKADAIDMAASIAMKIDWRQAVAVHNKLQTMCKEPIARFERPDSGRKSVSSKMDGDTPPGDFQLKQYWSDVLVSSVLEMKTK
jgi:hypothetical protein